MRASFASVLALCLGAATTVLAQNGVPYSGTFAPEPSAAQAPAASGASDNPENLPSPIDLASYARPQAAWFNAEWVLWWVRDDKSPPLIQTLPSNLVGSPLPPGSTSTLFPSRNEINFSPFNGLRLTGGFWLNSAGTIGVDASGFFLQQRSSSATYSSNGNPPLAESYYQANTGTPIAFLFANPSATNGYHGSISASSTVSSLDGVDGNFRFRANAIFADTTDYLFGGRFFDLNESLDTVAQATFKDGGRLIVSDHFATSNHFYGAQMGFDSRICGFGGFSVEGIVKLAVGDVNQVTQISGYNTIVGPLGRSSTQEGGLYAQPSNIGTHTENRLGVLPEAGLNFSYNFTDHLAVYTGYNILLLNSVARPGSAINTVVNDANLRYVASPAPGNSNQPQFSTRDQSFWTQGFQVGVRLQF